MYNFARSLINSIEKDMDNNEKIEPARFYTVSKMLKMMNVAKSYEDKITEENRKFEEDKPKVLDRETGGLGRKENYYTPLQTLCNL